MTLNNLKRRIKLRKILAFATIGCAVVGLAGCDSSRFERPNTTRALREFFGSDSIARQIHESVHYGTDFRQLRFLHSSANQEGVKLAYSLEWISEFTPNEVDHTEIQFICDEHGVLQNMDAYSSTAKVNQPFVVSNGGLVLLKALEDSMTAYLGGGLPDDELAKLNSIKDARTRLTSALQFEQEKAGFPMPDEAPGDGIGISPLGILAVGAVIVFFIGGGIFLATRGRNKSLPLQPAHAFASAAPYGQHLPTPPAQYPPPVQPVYAPPTLPMPPQAQQRSLALYAVRGPLAGSCFPVDARGIAIGRDPQSSQVLFRVDDRMISKRHCVVRLDPSQRGVLLEDCGSTNGTYLESGERTASGAPRLLAPGTTFYLGDREHSFQVREG